MSKTALATASVLVLLCACSRTQTYSTKDATVTVTDKGKDQGSVHVSGKDGASLDINTGRPITDYPSDTPLYSGKSMMDMKSGEKSSRVVAIQTSDSLEKISGFYKSELDSKGWKIDTNMTTPEMTMYVASKGERKLVIQISTDASSKMQTVSQTLADK
jgi:hypothetical protein